MKCKHENADHLMPGELLDFDEPHTPTWRVTVEQFRCLDCGSWLSLGPANNDGPHAEQVAIEIRAAELAADPRPWIAAFRSVGCHGDWFGWCQHVAAEFDPTATMLPNEQAGYLARCIAQHDAEQERE